MRAEEGRADRDVALIGEVARDAERFAFGGEIEPIAGFDFDRAYALGDQGVETLQRRARKLVLACGAGRAHGGENAAAFARDLFVACARKPHLEFVRPVAAVDEMGVAVDEGGRDPAAFAIDAPLSGMRRRKLALRACESDTSVAGGDRAGLDDSKSWASFD